MTDVIICNFGQAFESLQICNLKMFTIPSPPPFYFYGLVDFFVKPTTL